MTNIVVKPIESSILVSDPDTVDRIEERLAEYSSTAAYLQRVSYTPDHLFMSETHSSSIFATTGQASQAARRDSVRMVGGLVLIFMTFLVSGEMGDKFGAVAGILAGMTAFGVGVVALNRSTAFMQAESFPVSKSMLAAWSAARPVLERADEENTVPAILAELQTFEAEARTIYSTYAELISEVDREQAQYDFLIVCAVIELLGQEATQARYDLYSTRRSQYLP